MSGQKKTHLKAVSYSFEDRGSLSQQKDLDVNYIAYKPTTGKRGKPSWLESCAPLGQRPLSPSRYWIIFSLMPWNARLRQGVSLKNSQG
jgi:hypothetical protein